MYLLNVFCDFFRKTKVPISQRLLAEQRHQSRRPSRAAVVVILLILRNCGPMNGLLLRLATFDCGRRPRRHAYNFDRYINIVFCCRFDRWDV